MLTALEVLAIGLVIVAVGGVKLVYAYLADKAGQCLGHCFSQPINHLGAIVLLGVGLWSVYGS
jgi:putative Mn2+ efflux pump MntP